MLGPFSTLSLSSPDEPWCTSLSDKYGMWEVMPRLPEHIFGLCATLTDAVVYLGICVFVSG